MNRDLDLKSRKESSRNQHNTLISIQFSLEEINSHFDESYIDILKQLEVANNLLLAGNRFECENLWRSQIVFIEGILDFYIHEVSKYGLYRMFVDDWPSSEQFENFMIPIKQVEEIIGSRDKKPFFDYLTERFSREVYLSSESMKDQLNLIGIPFRSIMHHIFPDCPEKESIKKGKKAITELYDRRNCIAHQGDRKHHNAQKNEISKEYVEDALAFVVNLVIAIYHIANENDSSEIE